MIKVRKLKGYVLPMITGLLLIVLFAIAMLIKSNVTETVFESDNNYRYTTKSIFRNYIPTVSEDITVSKPFTVEDVKIYKDYYNYKSDDDSRKNSIIYYENVYMQNSGIDYTSENDFDVISILDGTVIAVDEDEMLGKYVEIRHSNDIISIYQSLGNVNVKVDDEVTRGQVIATSGKNNLYEDMEHGLHFELSYKGSYVNPNDYFLKKVQDL